MISKLLSELSNLLKDLVKVAVEKETLSTSSQPIAEITKHNPMKVWLIWSCQNWEFSGIMGVVKSKGVWIVVRKERMMDVQWKWSAGSGIAWFNVSHWAT